MGRRLSILMGLMLILACPLARGQDPKTEGTRRGMPRSLPCRRSLPRSRPRARTPKAREAAPALAIPPAGELPVPEPAAEVTARR